MIVDVEQGKRKRSTRSLDDIDRDLVIEILHRLPHKYVILCKCVSKHWLHLISSPDFVVRFLSMQKNLWTFMYSPDETGRALMATSKDSVFEFPGFSLRFLPCYRVQPRGQEPICVVKTFNDLFLCCRRKYFQWAYYICNPLTMQWVALPPSIYCYNEVCVDFTCCKKDSTTQSGGVGVALNTQYMCKVVRVSKKGYSKSLSLEIFSSETGQWTETMMQIPNIDRSDYIIHDVVTCDGKITLFGVGAFGPKLNIIINVDVDGGSGQVDTHLFSSSGDFDGWPKGSLGPLMACRGHLRFARVIKSISGPILKIWEFTQCKWSLVHQVRFGEIVSDNEWVSNNYLNRTFLTHDMERERHMEMENEGHVHIPIVLGIDPNDENILYLNLFCNDSMAKYDMRGRTLNLVPDTRLASFVNPKDNVFQLVLPLCPTMIPQVVIPN